MKVLIFEDEIPAYEKLRSFIEAAIPEFQLVAWCRSIAEANMVLKKNPEIDLVFSDIELLDGASFQIFETFDVSCPIIFCTAFDQYLFKAFQTNGIAYLLKPYTQENFKEALQKYQNLFGNNNKSNISPEVLDQIKSILSNEKSYKNRFSVKKKSGIKLLSVDDIVSIEANGDFCMAHDKLGQKHVLNYSIGDIENKVDPSLFFRINRSEIIHIIYIENIESHFKNKLAIKLAHRTDLVYTSGAKTPDFRKWIS